MGCARDAGRGTIFVPRNRAETTANPLT